MRSVSRTYRLARLLAAAALLPWLHGGPWLPRALGQAVDAGGIGPGYDGTPAGDGAAHHLAFSEVLWAAAWGAPFDPESSGVSCTVPAPVAGGADAVASMEGPWLLQVWYDDGGVEPDDPGATPEEVLEQLEGQVVAEGTLAAAAVYLLAGDAATTDAADDAGFAAGLDLFVVAGVLTGSTGFQSPVVGYAARMTAQPEGDPASSTVTWSLIPMAFAADLDEAVEVAHDLAALAGESPRDALAGPSGLADCQHPEQAGVSECECFCQSEHAAAVVRCRDQLRAAIRICVGAALLAAAGCLALCHVLWPAPPAWYACLRECLSIALGAIAQLCLAEIFFNAPRCLLAADIAYQRCLANCPPD